MKKSIEIEILPAQPLKPLPLSWTIIEVLEIPLKFDSSLALCLLELTEAGQFKHGVNKELSIAPEWYSIPEHLALGMYDGKTYYLNGTQCGFRHVEPKEVKQCIEIGLTADYLLSIEEAAKAFKTKMPKAKVQYTDTILYNAIQQHIPR